MILRLFQLTSISQSFGIYTALQDLYFYVAQTGNGLYSLSRRSQHLPSLLSARETKCIKANVDSSRNNGHKSASPRRRGSRSSVPLSLRLYVCQVSDCQWKSKNHFNYHRHVFSHLKLQAKFQCQYCHKEISSNSGKCGYGQKRFRCSECDIEPMTKLALFWLLLAYLSCFLALQSQCDILLLA